MIVFVGYDHMALSRDGNAGRPVELAGTHSLRSELVLEDAVRVEDLHPVVAPVAHNHVALLIATDAPRPAELRILGALRSKHLGDDSKPPVLSPAINDQREGTPLHVLPSDSDDQLVLSLLPRAEVDRVGPVLVIPDVDRQLGPSAVD